MNPKVRACVRWKFMCILRMHMRHVREREKKIMIISILVTRFPLAMSVLSGFISFSLSLGSSLTRICCLVISSCACNSLDMSKLVSAKALLTSVHAYSVWPKWAASTHLLSKYKLALLLRHVRQSHFDQSNPRKSTTWVWCGPNFPHFRLGRSSDRAFSLISVLYLLSGEGWPKHPICTDGSSIVGSRTLPSFFGYFLYLPIF